MQNHLHGPIVIFSSRSGGPQISEADNKTVPTRNPREETAAQLALAAAAQINTRQGVAGNVAPPPPLPQQHQHQQRSQQISGPPPPPVPQGVRPRMPNQQQQFLYQQGVLPPQGPQIRGPAPRLIVPNGIRFPNDPHQQQQQHQQFIRPPQQHIGPNPNYNQSNNNELYDSDDDDDDDDDNTTDFELRKQEERSRSAEKILDAFERFYANQTRTSTVPMKVKYIPEEMNSHCKHFNSFQQRNTNNNNRYRSSSRRSSSTSSVSSTCSSPSSSIYSSPLSSRRSFYDNHQSKLVGVF